MSKIDRDLAREGRIRARFLKAGFADPRCVICGEDRIWRLELDHVAGQKHDPTLWPLCRNCHADRSFLQYDEPRPSDNPKRTLEVIGRWMLGLAQFLEPASPSRVMEETSCSPKTDDDGAAPIERRSILLRGYVETKPPPEREGSWLRPA
jgi:hypothetical protein